MKKTICILLSILLLVSLVGCGEDAVSSNTSSSLIDGSFEKTEPIRFTQEFIQNCNKNSGGYIVYGNDTYYYADIKDDYKIFKCDKNGEKIVCIDEHNNAAIPKMSVKNGYVYYLRSRLLEKPEQISDFEIIYYNQLCRYKDGKIEELSAENVISYTVSDDYIFYTTTQSKVYRMNIDGTDKKQIFITSFPMNIQTDNSLLYLSVNEMVITIDFSGENEKVYKLPHYVFAVNGNEYYYIDLNGFGLLKTKNLSKVETECVLDKEILSFTIHKDRIIYTDMNTDEIVSCNYDGTDLKVLLKNASSPISLGEYLVCISDGKIVLLN